MVVRIKGNKQASLGTHALFGYGSSYSFPPTYMNGLFHVWVLFLNRMPGPGKSQGDLGSSFMQMREEKRKYNHLGWLNSGLFSLLVTYCVSSPAARQGKKTKGKGAAAVYRLQSRARQRNPSSCWRGTKLVPCRKSREISDSFGCVKNILGGWLGTGSVSCLCPLLPCGRACVES